MGVENKSSEKIELALQANAVALQQARAIRTVLDIVLAFDMGEEAEEGVKALVKSNDEFLQREENLEELLDALELSIRALL